MGPLPPRRVMYRLWISRRRVPPSRRTPGRGRRRRR
ncbi:unnamed protein product [Spirodela intermedia]|uniref:Uncharacterized protein n=1 Tax=Spirodela intermedia TaxID=51605 RepID=A0A7I8KIC7_SPIIN|nr:unnamed protein product [Spirodela intermedia]